MSNVKSPPKDKPSQPVIKDEVLAPVPSSPVYIDRHGNLVDANGFPVVVDSEPADK